MRSFLEFLNEKERTAQSKLTEHLLYEAEEKDDALEYEEDGKKIRIIKRGDKYFKQVQEGDTWGKETESNSEDWTAAESKPGVKSTKVSKPQTQQKPQPKPQPKPETGWTGKYEWVDAKGHTHSIEGKKVGDEYVYYKDGKEFDDTNAAKSYKDAVVNKEVAAINRETEKDGEVEASFGYDDDDGHHTITYKVDSKTGKTKPGSFKQDGKPVEDNKLDNIKKELEKKTAAADAEAAEAAAKEKAERDKKEQDFVIEYDDDGNKIEWKKYSDNSYSKKTYKKTDDGFEETPFKSEKPDKYEFQAADARAKKRADAEAIEPANDFEGEAETKLPNGETIKIKGIGDGKYVRIKDDGTEDPMDPETARKLKTAIDDKKSAELIAQINGTNKSDSQSVTTEENGEKVTRVKNTSWDGKVTWQIKKGDGELEDDPQGSDTIFNAAKAKADKDYINKNLKDVEMQAGTLTKVANDDGSTTIAFKDKDGNYKSYDVPKDEDPKTYKPEKYNDKLTQTEYDELQKTEKKQHKKPADRGDIVKDGEANYTDENGTHYNVKQYENGDVVKQKMKEEDGKLVPDGEPEVSKDTGVLKDAQSKQAIERKRSEEAAKKGEEDSIEKSFKFDSGDGEVEMHSKKDDKGKMHYFKKENGKEVEIDKKEFDKGAEYKEKDIERARQLKQKAEDEERELVKKAREEALKGKDKSEKSEPSEAKKAWDGALDKMAVSGNIFGQIIGHTGKILTGLVAGAVGFAAGKLKNDDLNTDVVAAQLANLDMMFKDNADKLAELSDDEKEALEDTREDLNKAMRAVVDEKGEPVPLSEREKILKGNMSDDEWEEWKQKHADSFNKMKDTEGFDAFGDLSELSNEQLEKVNAYKDEMNKRAHNKAANDIVEETQKKRAEEMSDYQKELENIKNERKSEEESLDNYKKDIDNKQKELDNIKRENGESRKAFRARKAKIQRELTDAQENYEKKSDEVKEKYADKEKEARENHKKRRQEIQKEHNEKMKEAGFETLDELQKAAEKHKETVKSEPSDEDDNEQEGDTEKELDTSDMEDEDEGNTKQDPHKVWKQKTYKRGNKTMKTKSYYNKKGNSISADEFKKKVQKFEENSAKNEGLGKYLKVRLLNENLTIDKYLTNILK